MKIAILDDYQDAVRRLDAFSLLAGHEVAVLTDHLGPDELVQRLAAVEAIVPIRERTRLDRGLLEQLPRLRVVAQTGRAGRHLDVAATEALGIAVLEGSGSPVATAELTWALVLAASRRLPQYRDNLRAGRWQRTGLELIDGGLGHVLRGRTLGILGYGRIGRLVASYGDAFGMKVLAWGREDSKIAAYGAGHEVVESQAALFAESDVVSVHLRLTDETTGIIRASDLARMRPDALFVNTARAELVAPGALTAALQAGTPGAAAVDVYEDEPALSDPLLALANVVTTPHIGFVERSSYERMFGSAFRNLLDWHAGAGR